MAGLFRDLSVGFLGSVAAALFLAIAGLIANKVSRSATLWAKLGFNNIKYVQPSQIPGPVLRALRPKFVFLGLSLAVATSLIDAPIVLNPPDLEPYQQKGFITAEANSIMQSAMDEANSIVEKAVENAQAIMEDAEERTLNLRQSKDHGADSAARRLTDSAKDRADFLMKWNNDQAARLIRHAEETAQILRQRADAIGYQTPLFSGVRSALVVFSLELAWGLLLAGYLAYAGSVLGVGRPTIAGFVAVLIIVVLAGAFAALAPGPSLLGLFRPLLIAAAFFASREPRIRGGDVIVNCPILLYRRFGVALLITFVSICSALLTTVGVVYLFVTEEHGSTPLFDSLMLTLGGPVDIIAELPFNEAFTTRIVPFIGDFFNLWFAAISGVAFSSVLLGPASVACSKPTITSPPPSDTVE